MALNLTAVQIKRILDHWVNTPPNGYIGVNYGRNLAERLLKAIDEDDADQIIQWIKEDIPLFKNLNSNQLSIYSENNGIDQKYYFIKVGEISIQLPTIYELNAISGDTYDANAY